MAIIIKHQCILTICRISLGAEDLFAYFEARAAANELPTLETLEEIAKDLNRRYSSSRAYHRALHEQDPDEQYSVKVGSPWMPPAAEESSQNIISASASTKRRRAKKPNKNTPDSNNANDETPLLTKQAKGKKKTAIVAPNSSFQGDRSLAKSIKFMHEAMISREAAYAVAEGDIGRAYECVKVSLELG
jgi:hypothetical protein